MRNALAALVLLLTSHCVTPPRAMPLPAQPAPTLTGGRCGATPGPSPFKNPKAVHFLVADFHGASSPETDFSQTVSERVTQALESFKEEELRNPKKMDLEVPEGSLEIARLPCFLDNHEQAEAVAKALDADVVLWGQAFCNLTPAVVVNNQSTTTVGDVSTGQNSTVKIGTTEVQAPRPYTVCPKATLYRAERSLRRGSERGMDLASLGHLDLPALSSTEPFLLIQFALGLHFYELENYGLAARFFKTSAEHVLTTERNVETLDVMLGEVYLHLPDPNLSLLHSRRALERVRGSGNEMEGVLVNNIGIALDAQGEYAGALEHFRRALAMGEKTLGKDHPIVATRLNNIGLALHAQGEYAEALEHYRRALAMGEKTLGKDHPNVAARLNNIGLALYEQGEYAGALEHYRQALAIDEKALGKDYPNVATRLNNIGLALQAQGEYAGALEHYRRALAMGEKTLGKDHPHVASVLNNIGGALDGQGEYAGALEHYRRALAINEKALGKDHPNVATLLNNIGSALEEQGEYAGALEHYRRALAIGEKSLGQDHPIVATSLNNIGGALDGQGEYAGALEHYRRALAIGEKSFGQDHPNVATSLNNIGGVLQTQGEYAGALDHFRRALVIAEKALGKEHPTTQTIRGHLAQVTALKNAPSSDGK